jgi:hypothetical protein
MHAGSRRIHYERKKASRNHMARWNATGRAKENAMNAPEIMLVMLVVRVVIPVGLLLWVGESARRRRLGDLHQA